MRIVRNPLRHLLVLFFLDGLLAASLIYLKVEAHRENRLIDALKQRVDREAGPATPPLATVLTAMHLTHDLVYDRTMVPGKKKGTLVYRPPSGLATLLPGNGAFGSYSTALARLLDAYDYPVRIGQIDANGQLAGAGIVETWVSGRWIVLDPSYSLIPEGYDPNRRYEAVRYTNWDKLLVSMSVYDFWFYVGLFVFALLNIYLYCGIHGSLPWQKSALRRMIF